MPYGCPIDSHDAGHLASILTDYELLGYHGRARYTQMALKAPQEGPPQGNRQGNIIAL